MSSTRTTAVKNTVSDRRHRPATVWVATVLTYALAAVTSYGATYFTLFWEGAPQRSVGTVLFVVAFIAVAVTGVAAATNVFKGSNTARKVLIGYALFGICFTVAKLIWWQETEATVFGAADVALIALAMSRSVRSYTA
jgi:hypothetical protein